MSDPAWLPRATLALGMATPLLGGCALTEAERAAEAAGAYVEAYGRGDREAVLALTVPSRRDHPWEDTMRDIFRGFTGEAEAEVEGNWAVAVARFRFPGPTGTLPLLMRRTDDGWRVASVFPPGLTEVFSAFPEYPDRPADSLKYMPIRRLTSRAWMEDGETAELRTGSPVDLLLTTPMTELVRHLGFRAPGTGSEERESTAASFFKFTVRGFRRVRITATSPSGASLHLQLVTPEGGRRTSGDRDSGRHGDRFHESDGEARIEMNLSNATYLLGVLARKGTPIRLELESIPHCSPPKEGVER